MKALEIGRWACGFALAASLGACGSAHATSEPEIENRVADAIPERPAEALSGSEFARATVGWSGANRQRAIVEELSRGNLPEFLRRLVPVHLTLAPSRGEQSLTAILWVMPDYLAIGSNEDFLRVPLDMDSALTVANRFGCVLPTPKIVDAVYEQAALRLEPIPMPPGPKMRSSVYYLEHQQQIEKQRAGQASGELTAGHKKDVVITNRLFTRRDRVAIYGWHREKGGPIQPLSTVHGEKYADYSHGVRLVLATMSVDGREMRVVDALQDPALAPLLTREGTIRDPRRLMTP